MNQIQLTIDGKKALQEELKFLVEEKRPKLVDRLSYARQQGDLSENSDYANAKEELEFLDGRIEEIEDVLKNAKIVATVNGNGVVGVGAKVTVKINGREITYDIVGEWEADPMNKKISHTSPLGQALSGKKKGESIEVEAPAGKIVYEILKVE